MIFQSNRAEKLKLQVYQTTQINVFNQLKVLEIPNFYTQHAIIHYLTYFEEPLAFKYENYNFQNLTPMLG